ncbi:long-chain fatty acid--CoA ligase [Streptomyces canus]|uniref:Long-chain fatty acid--CoA ligase n=1 Tax=Streptomyces canus TaxID=58343 RepID=A0A101RKR2_9ACTN|nr:acyl-CoA synthetase [Streptomyces canus]KUN57412.1 long-chain fatty acid--CoA ligase [Streptomyces canus]
MATIVSGDRRLDAADLQLRIGRAATGFAALGLGPGSSVAFCLRNDIEFYEVSLGAGVLGAYAVPINWHFSPEEMRYILEDSQARVLVIHADLLPRLRSGIPDGVQVLVVPTPAALRTAYGIEEAAGAVAPGETCWHDWVDGFAPRSEPPKETPMAVFYTSGTTGRPKGVRRPAFTPVQQAAVVRMVSLSFGLTIVDDPGEIVTAVAGPTYHGAPNMHAFFSFRAGANIVILPRFDGEELLRAIQDERITHLHLVPVMFNRLLKLAPEVRARYDLSSLRFVTHAAAPCAPDVKRAMIDWWGPIIHEYYGSTEGGNVTFCDSAESLAHPGTVGRAVDGAEIRILGEAGQELGPGEVGEIAVRYAGVGDFSYHNADAKRREVDRDGLVTVGDVGYLDEDGYLYICDRKIDMVISGGVNIYPAEIEAVLCDMPGIADSAVFGIPDEEFGESVCAVIQAEPGCAPTAEQVRAFLRERIAGYKVPRRIEFAETLPREDSGKIFKRKLRAPYWEQAGRAI